MNRKQRYLILLATLCCALLLVNSAVAMVSPTYHLDWFTPLTTGGGGASTSTHYAVNLTVGQTVRGASVSTNYGAGLGYWAGIVEQLRLYLPLIMR